MNTGKACAIFAQIDSNEYGDDEKGLAIYCVLKMPTHNGILKDGMLAVIKWLFDRLFEVEEVETP